MFQGQTMPPPEKPVKFMFAAVAANNGVRYVFSPVNPPVKKYPREILTSVEVFAL